MFVNSSSRSYTVGVKNTWNFERNQRRTELQPFSNAQKYVVYFERLLLSDGICSSNFSRIYLRSYL